MSKICLVLEGGGNRGVYTAGVLDAFLDAGIDIKNVYGVSAGALNALSYLAKQKGRHYRVNKDYALDKKCIDFKRIIVGKSVVNLNYLFNEVSRNIDPIDFDEFNKRGDYVVVATNVITGSPVYKRIDDYDLDYKYIMASASLPLFSKIIEVDDMKLLDGGISDPIPVMKAIEDGYDKIVVISTRDKGFTCKPYKFMTLYKSRYAKYPNFIKTMENRYNKYNVTRDLLTKLEMEKKVMTIYPSKPLLISNLEKDEDKLKSTYDLGYQDAKKVVNKIKEYIGGYVRV